MWRPEVNVQGSLGALPLLKRQDCSLSQGSLIRLAGWSESSRDLPITTSGPHKYIPTCPAFSCGSRRPDSGDMLTQQACQSTEPSLQDSVFLCPVRTIAFTSLYTNDKSLWRFLFLDEISNLILNAWPLDFIFQNKKPKYFFLWQRMYFLQFYDQRKLRHAAVIQLLCGCSACTKGKEMAKEEKTYLDGRRSRDFHQQRDEEEAPATVSTRKGEQNVHVPEKTSHGWQNIQENERQICRATYFPNIFISTFISYFKNNCAGELYAMSYSLYYTFENPKSQVHWVHYLKIMWN